MQKFRKGDRVVVKHSVKKSQYGGYFAGDLGTVVGQVDKDDYNPRKDIYVKFDKAISLNWLILKEEIEHVTKLHKVLL